LNQTIPCAIRALKDNKLQNIKLLYFLQKKSTEDEGWWRRRLRTVQFFQNQNKVNFFHWLKKSTKHEDVILK
jgi:hypothetical protein